MSANIIPLPAAAPESIAALTARLNEGDEDAFTSFYGLYCDRLFRYLLVLSRGDEELSRDLLQITMLKVARAIRPFATEIEFWHWLAAIARNSFIDAMRQRRRAPQMISLAETSPPNPAPAGSSSLDDCLFRALEQSLAELPPGERALIDAFYFGEASHHSLAKGLDTTSKAVESKLARVRQKLRATILRFLRHENT